MSDIEFVLTPQEFQQLTSRLISNDPLLTKIISQGNSQLAAQQQQPSNKGNSHERIPPQS